MEGNGMLYKLVELGLRKMYEYNKENAKVVKTMKAARLASEISALGEAAEALGLATAERYNDLLHMPPLVALRMDNLEA